MTLLLGSMLVLIAMGIPVAFAIAVSGVTYLTLFESVPIAAIAQRMVVGVDSFTLLAIPLFLLAGTLMARKNITLETKAPNSGMITHWCLNNKSSI